MSVARTAIGLGAMSLLLGGLGVRVALAAVPHSCDLVPQVEVARIVGNAVDVTRNPPFERDGVKGSSCAYYQSNRAGNSAVITVTTSGAGAPQARMKSYGEALVKGGGTAEPDTVAGLPALFTASKGGTVQMFVVKGDVLLGAGVHMPKDGKAAERDHSRALAAAALGGL